MAALSTGDCTAAEAGEAGGNARLEPVRKAGLRAWAAEVRASHGLYQRQSELRRTAKRALPVTRLQFWSFSFSLGLLTLMWWSAFAAGAG